VNCPREAGRVNILLQQICGMMGNKLLIIMLQCVPSPLVRGTVCETSARYSLSLRLCSRTRCPAWARSIREKASEEARSTKASGQESPEQLWRERRQLAAVSPCWRVGLRVASTKHSQRRGYVQKHPAQPGLEAPSTSPDCASSTRRNIKPNSRAGQNLEIQAQIQARGVLGFRRPDSSVQAPEPKSRNSGSVPGPGRSGLQAPPSQAFQARRDQPWGGAPGSRW